MHRYVVRSRPDKRRHGGRRLVVAAAAGATALVVAVIGAVAYWMTSGSGTASASTGTLTAATISAPSTSSGSVTISWNAQAAMTPSSANSGITYTVERKLGSDSFAAVSGGGCAGSLPYGTVSCTDPLAASGSYTYRVVADYAAAWTASSNEAGVSAVLDAAPPTTTVTFPGDGGVYNGIAYGSGCVPTGICGTATDAAGVDTVRVSVQGSGGYWTGTSFSGFSEYFIDATLDSAGATSTSWTLGLALPSDGSYTIHVQAKDTIGNDSEPSYTSSAIFTVDSSSPAQAVSLDTPVNAYLSSDTIYYRGSTSGSFKLVDAITDNGTGPESATFPAVSASGWTHAAETVTSGTGSNPTKSYTSSTYSWTAGPANPSTQTITGADGAGNTVNTDVAFSNDSAAPTGGVLTVSGGVATAAGSTTYYGTPSLIAYSISRTDYADVGSGLGSSTLTREAASLTSGGIADGVCGAYGAPTTLIGAPTQNGAAGITTGNCYRYTLTGTDRVGNTVSITTVVKVDTSSPSTPALALSAATGSTFVSGTTAFVNGQAGKSGGFTVTATTSDTQSGIERVSFPIPTDFTGGGDDSSSPYSAVYSWSGPVGAAPTQTVSAFNNASVSAASAFTITSDTDAPTAGALTVNGGVASTGGSTTFYGTPTAISYGISRTDFTDGGSGLLSSTLTREEAPLTSPGIADGTCGAYGAPTTLIGAPTQNGPAVTSGNCYRYTLTGTDRVGNTVSITTVVKIDTSAPSGPSLTVSAATGNTFINGTIAYINAQAGKSGNFTVSATTSDLQSGILKAAFPSPSGFSSGGGDDSSIPYSTSYAWSGAVGASGAQAVTAYNNAAVTAAANFTVTPDTANPTGGALTVNSTPASAAGSTSVNSNGSFAIDNRAPHADGGSGLASSVLTRDVTNLSGGTCGTSWTSTTTIVGTPLQNAAAGIASGNCYRYTYTGADNVGNETTVFTIVKVDTSAPTFGSPALTISETGAFAHYPGSGTTVYYNGPTGTDSSITVNAENVADAESGVQNVIFPALTGFTGGGTDANSPFSTIYTWSSATASGSQTVTATNGVNASATASFSLVRDVAAPTGGALTVNSTAATGAGSTSNNTTGSFAIARTDYSEAQSPTASGLISSDLVRTQATLNGDFTCGTFGSANTLSGAPAQSGLTNGCYRYTLTGTDNVANSNSILTTVLVDTVAPTATNVQLTGNGGSATSGDTLVVTYSELLDASRFCAAWANDGATKAIDGNGEATATITNNGAIDVLTVTTGSGVCAGGFNFGSVALGGDYVSTTRSFGGTGSNTTDLTWNPTARTLTIKLGNAGGAVSTGVAAGTPSYTADTDIKDRAGNPIGAGPYSGSPASRF